MVLVMATKQMLGMMADLMEMPKSIMSDLFALRHIT